MPARRLIAPHRFPKFDVLSNLILIAVPEIGKKFSGFGECWTSDRGRTPKMTILRKKGTFGPFRPLFIADSVDCWVLSRLAEAKSASPKPV
jgi:hypothetical protein